MPYSLWLHGLQTAKFPSPLPSPGFTQTHVHWVSDAIQPSNPLLSPSPPDFSLSKHQGLFQWISSSHQVVKVLELQLQDQSFQCISRTDFLWDGLAWSPFSLRDSQESFPTPQYKSISSLALSSLYGPTLTITHNCWKTIALTRRTFAGNVMSLDFNMLSNLVIAFLPRSKCLLISWLQSPFAVIFRAQENKVWHHFHGFPIYLPWNVGTGCHEISFLNVEF